ncbi:YheE family protein [Bacillus paralicheniformis]|uniref:YheE family protein n=1 Tax=Bacillus paralicheniformis TaxID=1648923 RepID=A0AAW6KA46_9BACI|nr:MULTISPECIES: YheE family protein [Bacillus]MBC8624006.1 YheE family protein [Robertmurraya crescens]MCD2369618.1 YheE family protein [Bacillus sp. BS3(2021)]MCJ2144936.1 YheE family protein [Bacillus sp. B19-2]MBL7476974.1 YheE family protein [Bacillus paralicheniformis]MBR8663222.1 YheE family protein [Bacillus paralicheniformis]
MAFMISHFQWKPLFKKERLPGWKISFYHKGIHYEGIYHKSGEIEWGSTYPPHDDEPSLKSEIHELMLFHIYE